MIDFRYHLVSIVAVFLALAIGIVVGAQALPTVVQSGLQAEMKTVQHNNRVLNTQNDQLSQQLAADNAFAQAASAGLVHDLLAGQSVVLVLAPGADSQTVTGVTTALRRAGATVTGQVVLLPQFFDTGSVTEQALSTAASSLAPPGVRLPRSAPDPQISGQQAAAQVISAAIVNSGLPTMTAQQRQAVLSGFGRQNFLQLNAADGSGSARLSGQATMAVVVIPAAVPAAKAGGPFNLALVSFTQDLQEASRGAVLAGAFAGSGPGSAIDMVSSGGAGIPLSTVDNADSAVGQIIVVQALRELLNPHPTPGSYGARTGSVPSPAPSPLTSLSPSPSPSRK